jgi:flagellar hook assembly protein FlgD
VIEFAVPDAGHVRLAVYDELGRLVRVLVDGSYNVGVFTALWDGRDEHGAEVSSGVYIYNITAGKFIGSKKMVLLR